MNAYQYVVLRCVPRADREEFINVGVVVFCDAVDYLDAAWDVDHDRLRALDPGLDRQRVCDGLEFVAAVCRGDASAGAVAHRPLSQRFGFLKAPRSTVVRPGPVHGGLTSDPAATLAHLMGTLVR